MKIVLDLIILAVYDIINSNEKKECVSMIVTSMEVQNNFGKYIELALNQEIIITKNGFAVARLIGMNRKSLSEQLCGIIPVDVDEELIKAERMKRH